jgi:hypothetical protein
VLDAFPPLTFTRETLPVAREAQRAMFLELVAQLGCVVVLAPLPRHLRANLALLN